MFNYVAFARLEGGYLEPPEDNRKVCCTCTFCKEDILEGDEYYELLGEIICESCMQEAHHYAEVS